MTTSFPFLKIARDHAVYGTTYADVLRASDTIERCMDAGTAVSVHRSSQLTRDVHHAVIAERKRRQLVLADWVDDMLRTETEKLMEWKQPIYWDDVPHKLSS